MGSHELLLEKYRVQTKSVDWNDAVFYGLGGLLLVMPFLGKMMMWFGLVTLVYIVAVFGLLMLEQIAPRFVPQFARFITTDQQVHEQFESVVVAVKTGDVGKAFYHSIEFICVALELPLRLGIHCLVRGPSPPR